MHATESLGGYFLIWPLFVARFVPTTPEWQKHWIKARLLDIARKIGLDEGGDYEQAERATRARPVQSVGYDFDALSLKSEWRAGVATAK